MSLPIPPAVGIHVSQTTLDVALLMRGKIKSKLFDNDLAGYRWLRKWLSERELDVAGLHVCVTADAPSGEALALALSAMGLVVSLVDAGSVRQFAHSELAHPQHLRLDAVLLARYCAVRQPPPWIAPPPAWRELRAWSERLAGLREIRQQEQQRSEQHQMAGQEALCRHIGQHVDWLDQQIGQLQDEIAAHLERYPELEPAAGEQRGQPEPAATESMRPH